MATKKYRLLKDLNLPMKSVKAGTLGYDSEYVGFVMFGSGNNRYAFTLNEVISHPDWFEEVKDEPFDCIFARIEKKPGLYYKETYKYELYTNQPIAFKIPEIKETIKNIVNEVEQPDIEKLEREAFEAGRYHFIGIPCAEGMKPSTAFFFNTFEQYKKSKQK